MHACRFDLHRFERGAEWCRQVTAGNKCVRSSGVCDVGGREPGGSEARGGLGVRAGETLLRAEVDVDVVRHIDGGLSG